MSSPSDSATAQHRAAFLREQKRELLTMWGGLIEKAGGSVVRAAVKARGEPSSDSLDQALADRQQLQALTFHNGDQMKFEAVMVALGKIEFGTYGKCEDCLDEVPAARLRAMPATQFCVGCQGRLEEATRSRGGAFGGRQVLTAGRRGQLV